MGEYTERKLPIYWMSQALNAYVKVIYTLTLRILTQTTVTSIRKMLIPRRTF